MDLQRVKSAKQGFRYGFQIHYIVTSYLTNQLITDPTYLPTNVILTFSGFGFL